MDNVTVELGPETDVAVGDQAVLIGTPGRRADPLPRRWRGRLGTINYEVTCGLSARVRGYTSVIALAGRRGTGARGRAALAGRRPGLGRGRRRSATRCSAARSRDVDVAVGGRSRGGRASGRGEAAARPRLRALGGVRRLAGARPASRASSATSRRSRADSIEADLALRDFTVNAMARPDRPAGTTDRPARRHGATSKAGVLRVLGAGRLRGRSAADAAPRAPGGRARLRAGRRDRAAHAGAAVGRLTEASPERIFAELRRLIVAPGALDGPRAGGPAGRPATPCCPSCHDLTGVEQSHFHHLDVYDHTIEVLHAADRARGRPRARVRRARAAAPRSAAASRSLTSSPAARRCASARCSTTSASRRRAACAPTGASRSSATTRSGEEMVRRDLPPAARERAPARVRRQAHPRAPGARLPRARAPARPRRAVLRATCATASPVEVEVTRAVVRRPARHSRAQRRGARIEAHLELARELMGAALDWRADGPPRRAVRGDDLATRAGHASPGPELGELLRRLEEAAYTGRGRSTATRRSRSPGGCARIPIDDRRLRGLRGRRRRGRRRGAGRRARGLPRPRALSSGSGCTSRAEEEFDSVRREFDLHELAVEDAIHAHQRPKLEMLRRHRVRGAEDRALRRLEEVVEFGEILIFVGTRLHRHRPPRRGQRAPRVRERIEQRSGAPAARARAPCCTRSSTGWWTTTLPAIEGSSRTSRRSRREVFSRPRRRSARAHLQAQARGARVPPTRPRRWSSRSTGSRAGRYDVSPRGGH